MNLNKIKLR